MYGEPSKQVQKSRSHSSSTSSKQSRKQSSPKSKLPKIPPSVTAPSEEDITEISPAVATHSRFAHF